MNYIQIRFPVKFEDRFSVANRNVGLLNTDKITIKWLDIEEDSKEGFVSGLIDYNHPKFINIIFSKLEDIVEIMDIPIEFRYVYREEEAYTGVDTKVGWRIKYRKI